MSRNRCLVLGSPIDVVTWDAALTRINRWATRHESRVVCICNVHSVVTAHADTELAEAIKTSDLATPDGYPIAWLSRRMGNAQQERIDGPGLMERYCEQACEAGVSVYLYGGAPETLARLQAELLRRYPGLIIAGAYSPPFRVLTRAEEEEVVARINASGAGVVWVGLGCPKQEKWMLRQRGQINAVMIGVGAAFDYHAGTLKRAPQWMQRSGLEWLYRLLKEPKRLWRRYLVTNAVFVMGAASQILFGKGARATK